MPDAQTPAPSIIIAQQQIAQQQQQCRRCGEHEVADRTADLCKECRWRFLLDVMLDSPRRL